MQEDFWFFDPINVSFLDSLVDFMETKDVKMSKLHSCHRYVSRPGTEIELKGFKGSTLLQPPAGSSTSNNSDFKNLGRLDIISC